MPSDHIFAATKTHRRWKWWRRIRNCSDIGHSHTTLACQQIAFDWCSKNGASIRERSSDGLSRPLMKKNKRWRWKSFNGCTNLRFKRFQLFGQNSLSLFPTALKYEKLYWKWIFIDDIAAYAHTYLCFCGYNFLNFIENWKFFSVTFISFVAFAIKIRQLKFPRKNRLDA